MTEWWGINEGSNAAAYTSNTAVRSQRCRDPTSMGGKKGSPSVKTELYDVPAKRNMDRGSTRRTVKFIERNAASGAPFYLYVGFTQFHPPWVVHPDFKNVSKAGLYSDIKQEVGRNIGRILEAIEKAGIANDTIVILTGDNGAGTLPQSGYATGEVGGSNGPWRGGLCTGYEGGLRTPAMVRWPGHVRAGAITDGNILGSGLVIQRSRRLSERPSAFLRTAQLMEWIKARSCSENRKIRKRACRNLCRRQGLCCEMA